MVPFLLFPACHAAGAHELPPQPGHVPDVGARDNGGPYQEPPRRRPRWSVVSGPQKGGASNSLGLAQRVSKPGCEDVSRKQQNKYTPPPPGTPIFGPLNAVAGTGSKEGGALARAGRVGWLGLGKGRGTKCTGGFSRGRVDLRRATHGLGIPAGPFIPSLPRCPYLPPPLLAPVNPPKLQALRAGPRWTPHPPPEACQRNTINATTFVRPKSTNANLMFD